MALSRKNKNTAKNTAKNVATTNVATTNVATTNVAATNVAATNTGMSAADAKKDNKKNRPARKTFCHPDDRARNMRGKVSAFWTSADGKAHVSSDLLNTTLQVEWIPYTKDGRPWKVIDLRTGGGGLTAEERARRKEDREAEEERVNLMTEEERAEYLASKAAEMKQIRDGKKARKRQRLLAEAKAAMESGMSLDEMLAQLIG